MRMMHIIRLRRQAHVVQRTDHAYHAAMTEEEKARTVRVQLLLNSAEAQQIDDWRFANRQPSRNDAIRSLLGLGLMAAESEARKVLAAAPDPKAFADDVEFHAAYGEWRQQALKAAR